MRPMRDPKFLRRATAALAALAAAASLAACGGGIYVGWGDDDFDDFDPVVSVAAAAASVRAGESARFVAAASDENGIDEVAFYRLDAGNSAVLIGRDTSVPYEMLVSAPADGRTSLSVFARATDRSGRQGDSAAVSIPVTP